MNKDELDIILDKHQKWLNDEDGGERANLSSANLSSANLSSANLSSANLSSANLGSANLRYANLSYANLSYANLRSAKGQYYITQRSDGYQFFLVQSQNGKWMIRAGCRWMSIESYRKHIKTYNDEAKELETKLILDFAEAKLEAQS